MSYIYRNLLADEEILFFTKKHVILFFIPVVCTILAIVAASYTSNNLVLAKISSLPWLFTFFVWGYFGLEYWASEYAVTNKRVMMREGFFYRHGTELRLSTIAQVQIVQSLLGQLLGYGTVTINSFGAFDTFTLLSKPDIFQRMVNEQLDKVVRSNK